VHYLSSKVSFAVLNVTVPVFYLLLFVDFDNIFVTSKVNLNLLHTVYILYATLTFIRSW
jgi:hypothetical protein